MKFIENSQYRILKACVSSVVDRGKIYLDSHISKNTRFCSKNGYENKILYIKLHKKYMIIINLNASIEQERFQLSAF